MEIRGRRKRNKARRIYTETYKEMMKAAAESYGIVIVGGGICGLATALALYRRGIKSIVLEKSKTLRATGAAIIVQANGWRALEELGIASTLRQTAIPIKSGYRVSITDGKRKEIPLGEELRCIKRTDLIKALADSLPHNTLRLGAQVLSIGTDQKTTSSTLQLQDGSVLLAQVVIGCDGVNSTIANSLGAKSAKRFSTSVVRGFTDYQNGHEFSSEFLIFSGDDHVQLGLLPVTGNQVYWFVTRKGSPQDPIISRDRGLIKQSTIESMKGFPRQAVEMIKNSNKDSLHLTEELRYRPPWDLLRTNFRRGNVTVAGDAMHSTGPFLAQGGSAALEDAVVLARCMDESFRIGPGSGLGIELTVQEAIGRYLKQRKMRVFWLSLQTYLIGTAISTSSMPMKALSIFLLVILFRDPIGHTRYDVSEL